jgi:hypothetical protein
MSDHRAGTRDEWLAARLEPLESEKELTRRSDELARRRQELPWVRLDKEYRFETDEGTAPLADLFRGRVGIVMADHADRLQCPLGYAAQNGRSRRSRVPPEEEFRGNARAYPRDGPGR